MDIQQQIARIKHIIKRHDYNWYVLGKASISKGELAALKAELDVLEKKALKENDQPPRKDEEQKDSKPGNKPKDGFEFDTLFGDN